MDEVDGWSNIDVANIHSLCNKLKFLYKKVIQNFTSHSKLQGFVYNEGIFASIEERRNSQAKVYIGTSSEADDE